MCSSREHRLRITRVKYERSSNGFICNDDARGGQAFPVYSGEFAHTQLNSACARVGSRKRGRPRFRGYRKEV